MFFALAKNLLKATALLAARLACPAGWAPPDAKSTHFLVARQQYVPGAAIDGFVAVEAPAARVDSAQKTYLNGSLQQR